MSLPAIFQTFSEGEDEKLSGTVTFYFTHVVLQPYEVTKHNLNLVPASVCPRPYSHFSLHARLDFFSSHPHIRLGGQLSFQKACLASVPLLLHSLAAAPHLVNVREDGLLRREDQKGQSGWSGWLHALWTWQMHSTKSFLWIPWKLFGSFSAGPSS